MGCSLCEVHLEESTRWNELETVPFSNGADSVLELIHPCNHLRAGQLSIEDWCPPIVSVELEHVLGLQAVLGFSPMHRQ